MLTVPGLKPRRYRSRRDRATSPPPPPAALTLVAAEYEPGVGVTLTFDRAVSLDGIQGGRIIVDDPDVTGDRYDCGGGAARVSANAIELRVRPIDGSQEPEIVLIAPPNNGIHATDGGSWAGTSRTVLPFP